MSPRRFPIIASVIATYSRHVKVGDSEAWCGVSLVVAVLRPFTPGEDAVVTWIRAQDDTELLDLVHLADGRDYVVLERKHVTQSRQDALREQERYINSLVARIPMQHGTSDTPTIHG